MTILPDLSDLMIEQVYVTNEVVITARATSPTASCPCCGSLSKRVHSHYQRTLRDLPASGRLVHLVMQVRRFFCEESTCMRKIFAERFPSLTLPRAKFTLRLQEALREMGFEQGGEAGARLGKKLSYERRVLIPSCGWSNKPNCQHPHLHASLGLMIGVGNADCAMER
jgi:hypothetical protein